MLPKLDSLSRSQSAGEDGAWRGELVRAYTHPQDLLDALRLDHGLLPAAIAAARHFRLLVPRGFAALMTPGDPQDPLLRQVLPLGEELAAYPGFGLDPVGDLAAARAPGLLQKYQGRALLIATAACAVHCRYCFRRHFPYASEATLSDRAAAALARLAQSPEVREVILSGGDPLMLGDAALADLIERLAAIPHLRRLRLHTRLPIVLPSRVTTALCGLLSGSRLTTVLVVHANHPRELGAAARDALARLRRAGLPLLNQGVLLRGVNDDVDTLAELSEALFAAGVLPYYLHLLDRVAGAGHFEVPEAEAVDLVRTLRARLPGYLVPRLVREEPGALSKIPVGG
ncbi:MAG: EF-P beta-lysylation protein EpmB [Chromatiaceae bacterium]|jgi:EF-P beta-lysylation protein EpmB|nr:EF-P beta-lysylation protein EpmB [Chromatiaceae bacterium]